MMFLVIKLKNHMRGNYRSMNKQMGFKMYVMPLLEEIFYPWVGQGLQHLGLALWLQLVAIEKR
jgi:hypothetical protein